MSDEKPSDTLPYPRLGKRSAIHRARLARRLMDMVTDPATPPERLLAARLLLHDPDIPDHFLFPDHIEKGRLGTLPKDRVLAIVKAGDAERALYFGALAESHPELRQPLKGYYKPGDFDHLRPGIRDVMLHPMLPMGAKESAMFDALLKKVETAGEHYSRMAPHERLSRAEQVRRQPKDRTRER